MTPEAAAPDLPALNTATPADFAAAVAPLFEGAPRFLARLADTRPFASWRVFFEHARTIAHEMPETEQVELVDAHPRLGAPPGSVSVMSFREQGYDMERAAAFAAAESAGERDGAPRAVADNHLGSFLDDTPLAPPGSDSSEAAAIERERARVAAKLAYLNERYEARFGFRYCVFVAGRPRSALIEEFAAALGRDRDAELHRALDAVIDIAMARRRA